MKKTLIRTRTMAKGTGNSRTNRMRTRNQSTTTTKIIRNGDYRMAKNTQTYSSFIKNNAQKLPMVNKCA
jgi:hypothetical protein